ncbi:hypothetical protein [Actinotalea sp. Marseille-Q4924]|uniref:hypothetical protein n=1 Tax=Actinotalea sp. Marseille-Q4924 TaxID=2866571 RepID=UPI001CE433FC|nr:hypothetical protein [Actinotalea sp. Marseille-Q4924]
MSMMEPFVPHPKDEETVAAADPGAGAPARADGVGTEPTAPEEFAREGRDPLTHEPIGADAADREGQRPDAP